MMAAEDERSEVLDLTQDLTCLITKSNKKSNSSLVVISDDECTADDDLAILYLDRSGPPLELASPPGGVVQLSCSNTGTSNSQQPSKGSRQKPEGNDSNVINLVSPPINQQLSVCDSVDADYLVALKLHQELNPDLEHDRMIAQMLHEQEVALLSNKKPNSTTKHLHPSSVLALGSTTVTSVSTAVASVSLRSTAVASGSTTVGSVASLPLSSTTVATVALGSTTVASGSTTVGSVPLGSNTVVSIPLSSTTVATVAPVALGSATVASGSTSVVPPVLPSGIGVGTAQLCEALTVGKKRPANKRSAKQSEKARKSQKRCYDSGNTSSLSIQSYSHLGIDSPAIQFLTSPTVNFMSVDIPSWWSPQPAHSLSKLVDLPPSEMEADLIASPLQSSGFCVIRLERIQTPHLWTRYLGEVKLFMQCREGKSQLNEQILYHCSKADKSVICAEGLDARLCVGGNFGRGIYFSDQPVKCNVYCPHGSQCYMYACKVILGDIKEYQKGHVDTALMREPSKADEAGSYYDSVKGFVAHSDEYVIYNSYRCIPLYVITYKRRK